MIKIINDVSELTNIPKLTLDHIIERFNLCITHAMYEAMIEKESKVELDIGLGTLVIKLEPNEIKYKFIPSKSLDDQVRFTVVNKKSPLMIEVDKALNERVQNAYKELVL